MSAPVPSITVRIERYAREHGVSYYEAAAQLQKRSVRKRRANARRKSAAQLNEERFEQMKASRPDLY